MNLNSDPPLSWAGILLLLLRPDLADDLENAELRTLNPGLRRPDRKKIC